jgi:UrcA family protein
MFVRPILAVAAATAAFAAAGLAGPAAAQSIATVPVAVSDLNLATNAGRQTLDGRIAFAARQLCGDYSHLELKWAAMSRSCQSEVIAAAQPQRDALIGGQRFASLRVSRAAN